MTKQYFKTSFFTLAFILFGLALKAQVITPFTSVYQVNQRGGIVFLSNSALGCSANPPVSSGTCLASSLEAPPLGTSVNDNYNSVYIDVDGNASTFMSSSDSLDLQSCSRITKAILFWGASGSGISGYNQVKLKVNNGSYQTIPATFSQTNTTGFNSYHCYADVTSLITAGGIKARITVADIVSSVVGSPNTFGSWNLAIVYQNDAMNVRQLTVYNGLANVSILSPTISLALSGFTTPATGTPGFEIGAYTHDGDRAVLGDGIMFRGNLLFVPVNDLTANPSGDVMNSTASNNGIFTPFRKPLLLNTNGYDADIHVPVNLLNTYLANSASTATLQFITTNDNYLTQAVSTAIDSDELDLRATIKARDVNGGTLNPGDIVEYRIKAANFGTANSVNTFITDTLPANVNYIPNSTSIIFGPNTGTLTDNTGDDQGNYSAATRILRVRIGGGANATNGGSVTNSFLGSDSTVVTFSVAVSQSCLKLSCNNTVTTRAYVTGTGSMSAITYTIGSTPATPSVGCLLQTPLNSVVSTTSCSTPTASSNSPLCAGITRSLTLNATGDAEAVYAWMGPNSFTSGIQNPTITPATTSLSGVYNVTLSIPSSTCQAIASTTVAVTICTPVAVNDNTATVINTSVTGNAATNDVNALPGGTFAITGQPSGGTVTINPSTGQYTFVPSGSFTGITTATYQLCNSLPVICSTASITFTVFANLVANPDLVNSTPSVTTSGSLLANDSGISSSATYTVSFTQLPSGTGTITVNPATGQYTFIPNPAFTGSAQTTYTVCNTSVNPQQCSSTTITIRVFPVPVPVNDAITTVINTSVSGNAATNDNGTAGGSFSIVGQPSNGTVTINPATGQFTYTPGINFTGVTSATYQLCNGAPITCSTAVISITVYPNLQANPDLANTTPSVSMSGNLLANDIGIVPNASYTVTVTQPASTTGTFVINPATGQYTFNPNPSYTGSVTTTYTVCNTSLSPQQCSSATITIYVSSLPLAVNDFTSTLINSTVSGSVGTNDSGTLGGTYTFGSASNGTLLTNPATGQYTFFPATGFSGTVVVSYTLCNLNSPPCSSASLTIIVYPTLQANPDAIVTAVATTTQGNLLSNDNGITASAIYSVNFTQLSTGTGTLLVNPTTGGYTFVPNSSFSGTAQTTYTVCNLSSNPQQCSSATITITVGSPPIAVNDTFVTTNATPVYGNVSINDSNFLNGTFSFGITSPSIGLLLGNTSTGQFTFIPTNGFSGTVAIGYTLCTQSPPCATAQIIFTVYPSLVANPDLVITPINTSVSANLGSNDNGMVAGGTYSFIAAPIPANVGTLTVNPTTGQYTFVPASGFTGSTTTSYTLAQYSGTMQLQSSVTTITIIVGTQGNPGSPLGIAKSISNVSYSQNNTFSLTYKIVVTNYSGQPMDSVAVSDNLSATFIAPATFTVNGTPTLITSGSQLMLNNSFSGSGSGTVLTMPMSSTLAPNRTDTISFRVTVNPRGSSAPANNSARLTAKRPGGTFSDVSVDGQNPDPDGDGNPGNNTSPTTFTYNLVKIGIAKFAARSISEANGCNMVTFKFVVKNYGGAPIYNVQITDDLVATFFNTQASYTVLSQPTSANGYLAPNGGFNGSSDINMLTAGSQLAGGKTDTISLKVRYCGDANSTFSNVAIASGNSLPGGGMMGSDVSTSGVDPDSNGNNDPTDDNNVTLFVPGLGFLVPQGFSPNGDGINDRFEIMGLAAYPRMEVSILNRWGNLVYSKKNYDNSWDGSANQGTLMGGNDLPEGTYFYIIKLDDSLDPIKGYVYLNRAVR